MPVDTQVPMHVFVTLHATVPFVGVVTPVHETHRFAQSRSPDGQGPQLPPVQLAPAAQTLVHAPQWVVSLCRLISQPSVTLLLQLAKPPLHDTTQTPATQLGVLFTVLHACPQLPQLSGSVIVLTHAPLPPGQLVGAVAGQVCPQAGGVPEHVALPLAGAPQFEQDNPHDVTDVELLTTQVPEQLCVPPGHAQRPAWQVMPPAHTVPQAPQLF